MRLAVLIHLVSLVAATLVAGTDINSTHTLNNYSPSSRHDGPFNDVRRSRVRLTEVSSFNHERDSTKESNCSTGINGRNCGSGETHRSSSVNTNSDGDVTSTIAQRLEATNLISRDTVRLAARARKKKQSTPKKKKAPKPPVKPATKSSTRKSSRIAAQNASTRKSSRIGANASNRNAAKNASTRKSSGIAANGSNRKAAKKTPSKANKPPTRTSRRKAAKQTATKAAAKKGTRKRPAPVSTLKTPTGPVAKDLDLLAEIRKFNMATEFSFLTTSPSSNGIKPQTMASLNIPPLNFSQGDFKVRPRKKQLYQVRSKMAFRNLQNSLPNARATISAAKELKLNEDVLSRLFDATINVANNVLESIFKQKMMWKKSTGNDQPIPDYVFGTGSRPLIVFELKTATTFFPRDSETIILNAEKYKFDPSGTTLLLQGSGRGQAKTAKMLQQVIAEMFYLDVKWGVLTNLEDWIIVEYDDSAGEIYLSHCPGSTGTKSKALDIMLEVSMRALGKM